MKNLNKRHVPSRRTLVALLFGLTLTLGGCGGGGGGDSGSDASLASTPVAELPVTAPAPSAAVPAPIPAPPAVASVLTPAPTPGATPPSTVAAVLNAVPLNVQVGPGNASNIPYVSVTLCTPGTSQCQTIDNMIVDTGSAGIRVFASKLNASLTLPQQTVGGNALAECVQYADSSAWGPVKTADVQIGGERVASLAVHVLADPSFAPVPTACSNTGRINQTPAAFGGNGIVGIGPFQQDCGPVCASYAEAGLYYQCVGSACQGTTLAVKNQVHNPVSLFAANNNGVLLVLPQVANTGAPSAQGSLIFGIGTQSNNGLGLATILAVDPNTGYFTTQYSAKQFSRSFLDSGSNGIFFTDPAIPLCRSGFYCPAQTLRLSAINRGVNGTSSAVNFSVINADTFFESDNYASDSLAGGGLDSNSFDFGLPFFFGKSIFTAIEGRSTPGGVGPYFAY